MPKTTEEQIAGARRLVAAMLSPTGEAPSPDEEAPSRDSPEGNRFLEMLLRNRHLPAASTGYRTRSLSEDDENFLSKNNGRRLCAEESALLEMVIRQNESLLTQVKNLESENARLKQALNHTRRRLWRENTASKIKLNVTDADVRTLRRISRLDPSQSSGDDLVYATRHHPHILERERRKRMGGTQMTRMGGTQMTETIKNVTTRGDDLELAEAFGWEDSIAEEASEDTTT